MNIIDVWNVDSFDADLRQILDEHADLIGSYVKTDKANFLAYDYRPTSGRPTLRPDNPHASEFLAFKETLMGVMQSRTIRAWHYTRMTDNEVETMQQCGIHLSTPETLRQRLDKLVIRGTISENLANELFCHSPFHGEQGPCRTKRFWLASHPLRIGDSGVTRLLKYWGGEVASFWTDDEKLLAPISNVGAPRVLEVAVPLASTKQAYYAAQAVIAAYARRIGCIESRHGFDICVVDPLPPSALLHVHREGDHTFARIGDGYPDNYTDVDRGYWRELTGEDD